MPPPASLLLSARTFSTATAAAVRASSSSTIKPRRLPRSSSLRCLLQPKRVFSSSAPRCQSQEDEPEEEIERVTDACDVCIVGGGPAGLSAAIRLKQLSNAAERDLRVVLLEKGPEVGSHILSGAVIEPRALNELIPDWQEKGAPLTQEATHDSMRWLTEKGDWPMPHPPQMANKGNYIVSLSRVTAWLAEQAEELGVEIYPGFAGAQLNMQDGQVAGVTTPDIGLDKHRQPKEHFEPGMTFQARLTLLAEGAHGSLTKKAESMFNLREHAQSQTYGLGVKEVWKVKPENHVPGKVVHTLGWPLAPEYGGSWIYHMDDGLVSLGLVIGLDYHNPHISPFREFQRMKHHPFFQQLLEGGECIAYGARALNEGGLQSIPKLTFPGGALIGCSAGFLNVPKIKGTHTAMKSGMVAAEEAFKAITENVAEDQMDLEDPENVASLQMETYQSAMEDSWVWKELQEVRNLRPSFHKFGMLGGLAYSGLDSLVLKGKTPWTFEHPGPDYAQTKPASQCKPIEYPNPDGKLSFDILTSVSRTGTMHAENTPSHLVVTDGDHVRHTKTNYGEYAGLLNKACPAGVYEYVDVSDAGGEEDALGRRFVINSQNCIHCKTCSIKAPVQDIEWRVPEGGGPKYSIT